jgi:crotonobetainyl-CoA:carnitine CoA-transferase CaiB-like acyl-CoA transferase
MSRSSLEADVQLACNGRKVWIGRPQPDIADQRRGEEVDIDPTDSAAVQPPRVHERHDLAMRHQRDLVHQAVGRQQLRASTLVADQQLAVDEIVAADLASIEQIVQPVGVRRLVSEEAKSPGDAVRDARVLQRGETVPIEHPTRGHVADMIGMGVPIVFSDGATGLDRPAPAIGEHNDLVYRDLLGYPPDAIASLRADDVI